MKKQYCITGALLVFSCFASLGWQQTATFGVGPSWHLFTSHETYQLLDPDFSFFVPVNEIIKAPASLMPFAYVDLATRSCRGTTLTALVGGAKSDRNQVEIGSSTQNAPGFLFKGRQEANGPISIALAAFMIGQELNWKYIIAKPILGIVINQENSNVKFVTQSPINAFYTIKNRWKGGLVGLELATPPGNCWAATIGYLFVPGSVTSRLRLALPPESLIINPNTPLSARYSSMRGNIWYICLDIPWGNAVNIGFNLDYLQYANSTPGTVSLQSVANPVTQAASLTLICWQQIIASFSISCRF